MRTRLEQAGPSCVLSEPARRPRLAEALSAGLSATLAELDTLGVTLAVDGDGYAALLDNLGAQPAGCLKSR